MFPNSHQLKPSSHELIGLTLAAKSPRHVSTQIKQKRFETPQTATFFSSKNKRKHLKERKSHKHVEESSPFLTFFLWQKWNLSLVFKHSLPRASDMWFNLRNENWHSINSETFYQASRMLLAVSGKNFHWFFKCKQKTFQIKIERKTILINFQ